MDQYGILGDLLRHGLIRGSADFYQDHRDDPNMCYPDKINQPVCVDAYVGENFAGLTPGHHVYIRYHPKDKTKLDVWTCSPEGP